jgi:hypothetical protein
MADQRTIEILLKARDEASRTLEQFSAKSLAGLATSAALAYVSIGKLTEAITSTISAAAQAEVAEQKLAFALRSVGDASAATLKQTIALSAALEAQSTFSDDAIQEAQALLAVLGRLSGEGLDRATRAAMDLATVLSVDLSTAATLMAKAAQGNTTALSRYGIVLSEGLDPAEKYEELLRKIEARFGGAAQAAVGTYTGQMANLTNAVDNLKEAYGSLFTQSGFVQASMQTLTILAAIQTEHVKGLIKALSNIPGVNLLVSGRTGPQEDPKGLGAGLGRPVTPPEVAEAEAATSNRIFGEHLASMLEAKRAYDEALAEAERQREEDRQERADRARAQQEENMMREVEHNREMQELEHERGVRWLDLLNRAHLALTKAQGQEIAQAAINSAKEINFSEEEKKTKVRNSLAVAAAGVQFAGEAFEHTKAIRIAEAIIDTAAAVAEALPNIPLAALVAALGAVQVYKIRTTKYAMGGFVTGGFPGQDSVPAMLMPGEYVIPAHEVQRQQQAGGGGAGVVVNMHFQGGVDAHGMPAGATRLLKDFKDLVERSGMALTATHIMRNGVPVAAARL